MRLNPAYDDSYLKQTGPVVVVVFVTVAYVWQLDYDYATVVHPKQCVVNTILSLLYPHPVLSIQIKPTGVCWWQL